MSTPESTLLAVQRRYRARLLAGERAAAREIAHGYAQAWQAVDRQLQDLLERMQAARQAGQEVGVGWLYREQRLRVLLATIEAEMARVSETATARTIRQQEQAVDLAIAQAAETIRRTAPGEPEYVEQVAQHIERQRTRREPFQHLIGTLSDGSPVRELFDALGDKASSDARAVLTAAVATGQHPRVTARQMRDAFGGNLSRALTVARTETLRAYRQSSQEVYRQPQVSQVLEGWVWMADVGPNTCAACLAMHGTLHPLHEEFGSHPNCFPAGTVVSGPKVVGSTARWYAGPVVEIETALGYRVTVTPNHPVLTPQGWVAAGLLNEGSDVISAPLSQRPLGQIDPDEYQIPALIEDVARSLGGALPVATVRVPTAAEDFHGDGGGSEVHVVRTNRLLRDALDATIVQPALDQDLRRGHVQPHALDGQRAFTPLSHRGPAPTHSGMGRLDVSPVLFRCAFGHHLPIGFEDAASLDAGVSQAAGDGWARHAEGLGQGVLGFPGQVTANYGVNVERDGVVVATERDSILSQHAVDHFLGDTVTATEFLARYAGAVQRDEVVKVRRLPQWRGHVYNLQTTEQWYNANGIIAHNCRCSPAPRAKGSRVAIETGEDWFARQDEATQRKVLGPGGYAAYRAGEITLADLVKTTHSEQWGTTRTVASLRSVLGADAARRFAAEGRPPAAPRPQRTTPQRRAAEPATAYTRERDRLLGTWVNGTGHRTSVLLKETVRAEFGLRGIVVNRRGFQLQPDEVSKVRETVRTMYTETQAALRAEGRQTITLYRGVKREFAAAGVVESWTTDLRTAKKFGSYGVIQQEIPIERIFMYSGGPGWKNGRYGEQYEYMVLSEVPR